MSIFKTRTSGVLLHIASLPSPFGIGDMGSKAYDFVNQLAAMGQRYWQLLPLNPSQPATGESPYFSGSAFAGNPLLIDLTALVREGWLTQDEIVPLVDLPPHDIDYAAVREWKWRLLRSAGERFAASPESEAKLSHFMSAHTWLADYVLFVAISEREETADWAKWPEPLRDRDPVALQQARQSLETEIREQVIAQYWFFSQWEALKAYANSKGIEVFGDMPIYVSYESSDVWVNRRYFKLDEQQRPTHVSGVPPDYFSATGQLWNNPVYDWETLEQDNFSWWIERMRALFERFDIVRIDHFRGLVQFWEVPAGHPTAIEGEWKPVPTRAFFDRLIECCPGFPVVVEDLGIITPDVVAEKNHYDLPGMLILQFAFGEDNPRNPYLPENHSENAVVYLGTHDNNTGIGWYVDECDDTARDRVARYIGESAGMENAIDGLIELTLSSKANTAIVTAQDLLHLPGRARINDPSDNFGNWKWRLSDGEYRALPWQSLAALTKKHGRHHS